MSRIHRDNFIKIIKTYNNPGHDIFDTGFVGAAGGGGVDWAGDGSDGNLTVSGETLSSSENTKNYGTLTIPSGQTLTLGSAGATPVPWIIYATDAIVIEGTINVSGRGGVGGNGGGGYAARYMTVETPTGTSQNPNGVINGTVNRGSGGGGGSSSVAPSIAGGQGGSGVVILRYTGSTTKATGGTVTTVGGYVYHTFNSSGTFTPTSA